MAPGEVAGGDPAAGGEARTARRAFVSGRVQGVGFRWYTADEARSRGLAGWVRNLWDGRVEVLVEGRPDLVAGMVDWLAHGPPAARVERVLDEPAEVAHRRTFEIAPSA